MYTYNSIYIRYSWALTNSIFGDQKPTSGAPWEVGITLRPALEVSPNTRCTLGPLGVNGDQPETAIGPKFNCLSQSVTI